MVKVLIIILVLVSIAFLLILYVVQMCRMAEKFQENLKIKDACVIYIGEEKVRCIVSAIFDSQIIVTDDCGNAISAHRTQVYPPTKLFVR